jgi:molecular chaperone HtpG
MEKFVEVVETNEDVKVNNNPHIPDDFSFSILSKLPLKSLKRFGCVCKPWSLLFKNPHFMNMLRKHFLSNNHHSNSGVTFLLLQKEEPHVLDKFYLLSNDKFENRVKLDLPPPIHGVDGIVYFLSSSSINGILCLGQDASRGMVSIFRVVLWNPATAEYMVIPPSPDEYVPPYRDPSFMFHGFGYDHVRDDYKLIRYISFFNVTDEDEDVPWEDRSYDPLLEIYSLRSNSWRILEIDMHDIAQCSYDQTFLGTGVYMDGVCHWWGNNDSYHSRGLLVSFDFSNEVLFTTPMLLDMGERCDFVIERRLVVLNESIALISNCFKTTTFHILILGELGIKELWIKLFIVETIPFIECPIGFGKKGICFKQKNDELVWIDINNQIIDEIGVKAERYTFQMGIYKESFLSIEGINN